MAETPQNIWKRCLEMFRSNVSEQQFATWFSPMKFKSYDAARHQLTLYIPSQFFFEYLEEHYRRLIHATISRFYGAEVTLAYQVAVVNKVTVTQPSDDAPQLSKSVTRREPNESPKLEDAVAPVEDLDSQLNQHLTFHNFLEGSSNKLPRSIGQAIAEHPEQHTFNPLFVYGSSGVGKTHLVNAIGMRAKELHPRMRVLYLSANLFEVQFTDSRRKNTFNDFIYFYQSIDLLIIDDIQELVGNEAPAATAATVASPVAAGAGEDLLAPLEGKFYLTKDNSETPKKVGDVVQAGDVLGYIEAMKTFNAIRADKAGTITAILCNSGDSVEEDDPIMKLA